METIRTSETSLNFSEATQLDISNYANVWSHGSPFQSLAFCARQSRESQDELSFIMTLHTLVQPVSQWPWCEWVIALCIYCTAWICSFFVPLLWRHIMSKIRTECLSNVDSRQGQWFVASPKHPDRQWDFSSLLFNGIPGVFLEVKRTDRKAHHTSVPNFEVTNEWNYASIHV
jgi:hypothetical protein